MGANRPQKQTSDKCEREVRERQPRQGSGSGEWGGEGIEVKAAEPGRSPKQNNKADAAGTDTLRSGGSRMKVPTASSVQVHVESETGGW